jgi:hypothetical protein
MQITQSAAQRLRVRRGAVSNRMRKSLSPAVAALSITHYGAPQARRGPSIRWFGRLFAWAGIRAYISPQLQTEEQVGIAIHLKANGFANAFRPA